MLVSPSSITKIVKWGICIVVVPEISIFSLRLHFWKIILKTYFYFLSLENTNRICPDHMGMVRNNKHGINRLLTFTSPPIYFVHITFVNITLVHMDKYKMKFEQKI